MNFHGCTFIPLGWLQIHNITKNGYKRKHEIYTCLVFHCVAKLKKEEEIIKDLYFISGL
jgi:hypothetical protein